MNRFGRYQLERRLAAGGMGEVFLARSVSPPGPLVVLKRMLPHLASDGSFVDLFVNEARVAARLVHPNIARTLEFGEASGQWFLAMELVDGVDLARVVARRGALPAVAAAKVGAQLAGALHWAQGLKDEQGRVLGVVHGDLCTRNVLLGRDGAVKLIDFGLSRLRRRAELAEDDVELRGTLSALAPEQVHGQPADASTDQFALGTLVFELLAGRPLFDGESDLETLALVTACRVELPAQWPAPLRAVLERMLSVSRDARFEDCGQVRAALEEYLADAGQGAPLETLLEGFEGLAEAPAAHVAVAAPELAEPAVEELLARLTPVERSVARQLAAWPGAHALEALEAKLDLTAFPGVWALDVLQSLIEQGAVSALDTRAGEREFTLSSRLAASL